MTLSFLPFLLKKSDKTDFFLTISLIEFFKRDYFYPIFAEIYRRKGFLDIADLLDCFSKKTASNLNSFGKVCSMSSKKTNFLLVPDGFFLEKSSTEMRVLLNLSIQEAISPRTSFSKINSIFLDCLRFNSEQFYPTLASYFNGLIKTSDKTEVLKRVEIYELLNFIVETERQNFRLIEKKLYY